MWVKKTVSVKAEEGLSARTEQLVEGLLPLCCGLERAAPSPGALVPKGVQFNLWVSSSLPYSRKGVSGVRCSVSINY